MKQPIEQCRGKNIVSCEQMSPPSKAGIGGQNDRAMNISGGDQLEEVVSLLLREPGIAHFIDDEQTGSDIASQALARVQPGCEALSRDCANSESCVNSTE